MPQLAHLAAISVAGPDAGAFLDAQFTQRVAALAPGEIALAAWCNPQGRVRALLRVLRAEEQHFLLVLPQALATATALALGRFILRRAVRIEPTLLPVWDARESPEAGQQQLIARGAHARAPERTLAVGHEAALAATSEGEDAATAPVDLAWRRADILAGLPQVYTATSGHWLPQSLDLEALGGLAYDKGCYPGQEIVARVHYRGTLKQTLARLTGEALADTTAPPAPGGVLLDTAGADVGEVVDAVVCKTSGRCFALAVLEVAHADGPLQTATAGLLLHREPAA